MFCEHCGKELKENETCNCMNSEDCTEKVIVQQMQTETQKEKKLKPWMLGVGIVAIILLIIVFFSKGEKVDLAAYINTEPKIYGANGSGSIDISELFDSLALENYLLESVSSDGSADVENMTDEELEEALLGVGESFLECEQILDDIIVQVWKDGEEVTELTNLSNGMKIKVKISSENPVNKALDMNFKTGIAEFTVEGLLEGREIDIFEEADLTITFTGTDGNGQAHIEWNEDALPELSYDFYVEEGWGCSNGDKKNVGLHYDIEEWEAKGYTPKETMRTYIVEGLNEAVTAISDIPEGQLEEKIAKDITSLKEDAEVEWRNQISIENITYLGSYLLTKKPESNAIGNENTLYMVYQIDAFENYAPDGGVDTRFSYYYYTTLGNLEFDEEEKLNMDSAPSSECFHYFTHDVCMGTSFIDSSVMVNYDGFETLKELYVADIKPYLDDYNCDSTIEDEN